MWSFFGFGKRRKSSLEISTKEPDAAEKALPLPQRSATVGSPNVTRKPLGIITISPPTTPASNFPKSRKRTLADSVCAVSDEVALTSFVEEVKNRRSLELGESCSESQCKWETLSVCGSASSTPIPDWSIDEKGWISAKREPISRRTSRIAHVSREELNYTILLNETDMFENESNELNGRREDKQESMSRHTSLNARRNQDSESRFNRKRSLDMSHVSVDVKKEPLSRASTIDNKPSVCNLENTRIKPEPISRQPSLHTTFKSECVRRSSFPSAFTLSKGGPVKPEPMSRRTSYAPRGTIKNEVISRRTSEISRNVKQSPSCQSSLSSVSPLQSLRSGDGSQKWVKSEFSRRSSVVSVSRDSPPICARRSISSKSPSRKINRETHSDDELWISPIKIRPRRGPSGDIFSQEPDDRRKESHTFKHNSGRAESEENTVLDISLVYPPGVPYEEAVNKQETRPGNLISRACSILNKQGFKRGIVSQSTLPEEDIHRFPGFVTATQYIDQSPEKNVNALLAPDPDMELEVTPQKEITTQRLSQVVEEETPVKQEHLDNSESVRPGIRSTQSGSISSQFVKEEMRSSPVFRSSVETEISICDSPPAQERYVIDEDSQDTPPRRTSSRPLSLPNLIDDYTRLSSYDQGWREEQPKAIRRYTGMAQVLQQYFSTCRSEKNIAKRKRGETSECILEGSTVSAWGVELIQSSLGPLVRRQVTSSSRARMSEIVRLPLTKVKTVTGEIIIDPLFVDHK